MFNVILVCTHHDELGKCNADELYKIIQSINPDVIFEELNSDLFNKFYTEKSIPFDTPEVKAVKKYIQNTSATHVPVDIDVSESLSTSEIEFMFNAIRKYHIYSKLENEHKELVFQEGYTFLNSLQCEEIFVQKKRLEKTLIDCDVWKSQLSRIHALFYDEQHNREHGIIKNIYKYSAEFQFDKAVLLLGSGHRRTIFEKIQVFESEGLKHINWEKYYC